MVISTARSGSSRILRHAQTRRAFSSTPRRFTHYQTLGLPKDASKAQIKSHFYRLSKQHHPDLSTDPASGNVFTKINEAYQVLSNDRERRAYDRTLLHRGTPLSGQTPYSPHAPPSRTTRSTFAWEYKYTTRTAKGTYTYTASSTGGPRKQRPAEASSANRPFTRPLYHDVLTGTRRKAEDFAKEVDRVRNLSATGRALQIVGFLAVGISLFGGFGLPGAVWIERVEYGPFWNYHS
ncbi:DnaJ-domain-containing protein [Coprinopsis marcescibilis]|uniref:DnaJ-domain-containing protein n=1 Tax=Coprinopsis marcescibilis TaxID=230819 RepID=A0A5C3KIZ6_COPMA|nr:DnaJ-domain-containing protein [Coprinopsis marcescibilis]